MLIVASDMLIQLAIASWAFHMFRHYARDRHALNEQLGEFQADDTQCFCCAVDHRMPGNGNKMPCDRRAIDLAIRCLFLGGMTEFERQVREMQGDVKKGLGSKALSYVDLLHLALPVLWFRLSVIGFVGVHLLEASRVNVKWRIFLLLLDANTGHCGCYFVFPVNTNVSQFLRDIAIPFESLQYGRLHRWVSMEHNPVILDGISGLCTSCQFVY